jgi:hypothetical protein
MPEAESLPKSESSLSLFGIAFSGMHRLFQMCFGGITMAVILSMLAVFPFLNLISLGYLMKASGEVAKSGRLRDGFIGFRKASRMGGMALGIWFCCWPIRLGLDLSHDASLISPDRTVSYGFQFGFLLLLCLTVWHILWALARGGRLRHFVWPAPLRFLLWIRDPERRGLPEMTWAGFIDWRSAYSCFKIGFAGFLAALIWLIIPVLMIFMANTVEKDPGILFSLLGGFMLAVVAIYLPFLQVQYVTEPHWMNLFNIRKIRKGFQHAPFAFAFGLFVTLLFSIPLYLLKIELAPSEIAWLPSLFFVMFIFPARLICGWAMHRSIRKTDRSHFVWRWICRLGVIAIGLFYGVMVFFTQFLTWHGTWSLLEQHAFMVPAPWLSL